MSFEYFRLPKYANPWLGSVAATKVEKHTSSPPIAVENLRITGTASAP